MKLRGRRMSELIQAAFEDGYEQGRADAEYLAMKAPGNYTKESAWKYSNTAYKYWDVIRLEEEEDDASKYVFGRITSESG